MSAAELSSDSRITHYASRPTFPARLFVYEINTRCWLRRLSESGGVQITLANVPESEFDRWRQLGFTHIWLMGVWTTGPRSRAVTLAVDDLKKAGGSPSSFSELNIAGSPYAIADYRVPETLGGETGLQQFRQKLHGRGMKLLLDFVPNHVGLDHSWVRERPELFVSSSAGAPGGFAQETSGGLRWLAHGKDPYFPPWADTVQLNTLQPATRSAMREELRGVANRCDGVRCDMAMLVLNDVFARTWTNLLPAGESRNDLPEFWAEAITATKRAHPDFLFLAEVYWGMEQRLQSLGFDYTYDKELYDDLVRRNPAGVQQRLLNATPQFLQASTHFLENHDEPRITSLLTPAEHRAAAWLLLSLPGMTLLHDGQLEGARIKVPVQLACSPVEPRVPEIAKMYDELFAALRESIVGRGRATILRPREAWAGNPTAQNIMLAQWQEEPTAFDLVAVNLAPHASQGYAPLNFGGSASRDWRMKVVLESGDYTRCAKDLQETGLYLDLPAHAAKLFQFRSSL